MDLTTYYDNLYQASTTKIKKEGCETDRLISSANDERFGITLLLRPPLEVKNRIQQFLSELKSVDAAQYYYPNTDLHITVMSIISCYSGFELTKISVPVYVELVQKSIAGIPPFTVRFKGITASPSCVMVQGFLQNEALHTLRNNLRENFRAAAVEQTIDKRYALQTAHATVVRFRKELQQQKEYLAILDKYRSFDFGTFTVQALELVYNDWYQRHEHVMLLHRFKLKST
ncbi:2'-5' RNA ligase family protein [Pontibacter chitinilyticus]|uniref:2'-5' RNA ligase family protein n=1 Tax=Pontibacter chitinilyticus TaxID=2674989 RepID=UPI003219124F